MVKINEKLQESSVNTFVHLKRYVSSVYVIATASLLSGVRIEAEQVTQCTYNVPLTHVRVTFFVAEEK